MISIQLSKGLKIDIKTNPYLPEGWMAFVPKEPHKSVYLYDTKEQKTYEIEPFRYIPFIEQIEDNNEFLFVMKDMMEICKKEINDVNIQET